MRTAVCNELFGELSLQESCRLTAAHGFAGIEIAPFTLAPDPTELSRARIAEIRKTIEGAGLECAGLHWLLAAPAGLHVTTDDEQVRRRSWDALKRVAALCGGLGGKVMVFGSPKQRTVAGMPAEQARDRLIAGLQGPRARPRAGRGQAARRSALAGADQRRHDPGRGPRGDRRGRQPVGQGDVRLSQRPRGKARPRASCSTRATS